jgi:hypothetical protein
LESLSLILKQVLYLSTMYRREDLALRIGLFFTGGGLAGAFGGLSWTIALNTNLKKFNSFQVCLPVASQLSVLEVGWKGGDGF